MTDKNIFVPIRWQYAFRCQHIIGGLHMILSFISQMLEFGGKRSAVARSLVKKLSALFMHHQWVGGREVYS
jgi:hypothetical protein